MVGTFFFNSIFSIQMCLLLWFRSNFFVVLNLIDIDGNLYPFFRHVKTSMRASGQRAFQMEICPSLYILMLWMMSKWKW